MRNSFGWRHWLTAIQSLAGRGPRPRRSRPRPYYIPLFESLEERFVPSTVQFGLVRESLLDTSGNFSIPVTLSAVSNTPVTVAFTLGGTAVSGTDFGNLTPSPVVIPAGQLAVNVTGSLLPANDGNQTLTFTLGTPSGNNTLGGNATNTLTITDPATDSIAISGNTVVEPAGNGTVNLVFTVTRTGDLTANATIGYTTVAGTAQPAADFTPTTGNVTLAPGASNATIAVPVFGNGRFDNPNLSFSVRLTGVVGTSGPASFAAQQTFATGSSPFTATAADINGDGKPDLLVANAGDGTVSVLLNTTAVGSANATFAAQQTFAADTRTKSVTAADLNGDGKPDLVTANYGNNTISVLLNTTAAGASAASFAAQQTFATTQPAFVTTGDVNGDGKPDILIANEFNLEVSVLLNTTAAGATAATFASQQTFATGREPKSVALADVNGDGKLDLVVGNYLDATVSVLLNTTAGNATTPTFAAQQTFAVGNGTNSVAVADVNGDGKPDILAGDQSDGAVSVLLNTTAVNASTATFAAQQTFATGSNPLSVAFADVNGDGKPDILAANEFSGTVSVLVNGTATGATAATFAAQQTFATAFFTYSVAAADVNGDGRPDILTANEFSSSVSVLLNTPGTIAGDLAAGTITESNPRPTVQFGTGNETVGEAAGTFNIPVNLSAASGTATTVPFTVTGNAAFGTDYTVTSPLVINAGQAAGNLAVALRDDGLYGGPFAKTLTLTLGTPGNATLGADHGQHADDRRDLDAAQLPEPDGQERYVQALYLAELGRAGVPSELDFWVGVMNGSGGAAAAVAGIKGSPEGTGHLVGTWYQLYLGRAAVNGEEMFWADKLRQGQTEESVLSQILGEPTNHEFYSRAQTLEASGTADERFVQALYQVLLFRTASTTEVNFQVNALAQESRQGLVSAFLQSREFRTDLFETYYEDLLHRPADQTGLSVFVSSSSDVTQVRAMFETSSEFMSNG